MRTKLLILVFVLLLAISFPAFAENPRLYESIKVKITQSGTMTLTDIINLNMSIFIPQERIESIAVFTDGGEWKYIYDSYGNKKILMEWTSPKSVINYKIETTVQNNAEHIYSDKPIGNNPDYVEETRYIQISDEIKRLAYPYEKSLKRVSELTKFVHDYLTYDLNYRGRNLTSSDVLREKRSVCSGYSTLLAAMLRANNIPTRYVTGYAYSDLQKRFLGHAWVEILLADGSWAPFDPTWLQGGFVDATHIKTGTTADATSATQISYTKTTKTGDVIWNENDDAFQILGYNTKSPISIKLDSKRSIFSNAFGYAKTTINSSECLISELTATSCVDRNGIPAFEIIDNNKALWSCGNKDVYFFFRPENEKKDNYICPLIVYDQLGNDDSDNITIYEKDKIDDIQISGLEVVKINDNFQLVANAGTGFIFYSDEFGVHSDAVWDLRINKPGTYKFYLYSNGALAVKNVSIVEQKEFELSLRMPKNITLSDSFITSLDVKNLESSEKNVKIITEFEDQTLEKNATFSGYEEKNFEFNLTAKTVGNQKLSISILSDTLTPYSSSIYVYQVRGSSWLDNIINSISDLFSNIAKWFGELF